MATINDFKSKLIGGGSRANLFDVRLSFPQLVLADVPGGETLSELGQFMVKGASLPASIINPIEVPFRGRKLKVAGDRTFEPWTITVVNDADMKLRNAFEIWMNYINSHASNTSDYGGSNSLGYFAQMNVYQLDRSGLATKEYKIHDAFPTNVSAIELNFETNDAIEEFTVEFNYQYWTSGSSAQF